jgi:NAD(P)-dependent dehydrogenase (short-subunit alcohol dehydrogenase family)/acyl carrier protein
LPGRKVQLGVISSGMQTVVGADGLRPEKATLFGPCRVIPQEYPNLTCCSVDFTIERSDQIAQLAEWAIREMLSRDGSNVVAYRRGRRFVQAFERLAFPEASTPSLIRPRGAYLITGGLGGVGLALAKYLAGSVQARLALLGRSSFPERADWQRWLESHPANDETSIRIRTIREAEERGASVLVIRADTSNHTEMRRAVDRVYRQYGALHGVIHAAGVAGGGLLQLRTASAADAVLSAKAKGALVLHEILKHSDLDFVVFCSSLSSVLGGVGQADYAAANAYVDALAQHCWDRGIHAISINWDTWSDVGMAVNAKLPKSLLGSEARALERGMSSEEGVEAFARVLQAGMPQVIVATTSFEAALQAQRATAAATKPASCEQEGAGATCQAAAAVSTSPKSPAPLADDVERTIAKIWEKLLGVDRVSSYDNFFDLGGHSLLGSQLLDELRSAFDIELPLRSLFEVPTVAGMAERLRSVSWSMEPPDRRGDAAAD